MARPKGAKDKKPRDLTNYKSNAPTNMKKNLEKNLPKPEISRIIGESFQFFKREPCKDCYLSAHCRPCTAIAIKTEKEFCMTNKYCKLWSKERE